VSPCVGHPAFSAEKRCSVLQVFRLSLFLRREGLPEELERRAEIWTEPIRADSDRSQLLQDIVHYRKNKEKQ
jgi:hypothetical protein